MQRESAMLFDSLKGESYSSGSIVLHLGISVLLCVLSSICKHEDSLFADMLPDVRLITMQLDKYWQIMF